MTQVQYPVIDTTLTTSVEQLENKNRQKPFLFFSLVKFLNVLNLPFPG